MLALADHRADELLLPCHPAGIPFFGRVLGTWFNFTETGEANGLITGQVLLAFGEIDVQIAPVVIVFHLVNRLDIHSAEDSNDFPDGIGFDGDDVVRFDAREVFNRFAEQLGAAARVGCIDFAGFAIACGHAGIAWNRDRADLAIVEVTGHHDDGVRTRDIAVAALAGFGIDEVCAGDGHTLAVPVVVFADKENIDPGFALKACLGVLNGLKEGDNATGLAGDALEDHPGAERAEAKCRDQWNLPPEAA